MSTYGLASYLLLFCSQGSYQSHRCRFRLQSSARDDEARRPPNRHSTSRSDGRIRARTRMALAGSGVVSESRTPCSSPMPRCCPVGNCGTRPCRIRTRQPHTKLSLRCRARRSTLGDQALRKEFRGARTSRAGLYSHKNSRASEPASAIVPPAQRGYPRTCQVGVRCRRSRE